ncbi:MAG: hypothetical protein ACNA7Y_03585 [Gammaproteobacteria bacterium]
MLIYSGPASANPFDNFAKSFPNLWKLSTALAYLLGFIFVIRSIMGFRAHAENRGGGGGLKLPIVLFLVGSVLIYTPTVVSTLMLSTFGYSSPFYQPTRIGFASKYANILLFIEFIGLISFIRGWVMIVGTAQQGSHHSMGKAITHIVGGLLGVNIGGTVDVLHKTFMP